MSSPFSFLQSRKSLVIIFFVIALGIGTYFRLYPLIEFASNDSQEKATLIVLAQLKNQVAQQIERNQPNITSTEKAQLQKQLFQELLNKESKRVRETIEKVTKNIDMQLDSEREYPYLLASDSFHFYNLTENIIRTGSISEEFQGSKYHNALMMAPHGFWEPITGHPYVGFLIYKVMSLFDRDTPLDYAVSFTPLLLTALCLLAFYFAAGQLNIAPICTFVGSIFFLLSPIFIKRSTFGWYDNDPYNIIFPLIIFTLFWRFLKPLARRDAILSGLGLALSILCFAYFWQGWVFFFSLIVGCFVLVLCQKAWTNKAHATTLLWQGLAFILGSFLFISIAFGPKEFGQLFLEGKIALENFLSPKLSVWPDLYISVGELHSASFSKIMSLLGSPIFGILAGLGVAFLAWQLFQKKSNQAFLYTTTLLLWLCASLYLSLGAQRFALLSFTPMSLLCLLGLQGIYTFFKDVVFTKLSPKTQSIGMIGISIALMISLIFPIADLHKQIKGLLNPIYNNIWDKALTQIKDKTPSNAIINTWWPPGHFIKATANRQVTFDGASINHPQAYWMANVFTSQSEVDALGILRMLNTSANTAADTLIEAGIKTSDAVALLKTSTKLNKNKAYLLMNNTLKDPNLSKHIISLTHNTPPPGYVLIFNEIAQKHIQFPFIAKWNFKAIEAINADPEKMKNVPARNSPEYLQFLWTLVGGPWRSSEALTELNRTDQFILFAEGVQLHRTTKDCLIQSKKYGQGIPQSIFYLQNGKVVEKKYPKANLPYSIVNITDGEKEMIYIMDRPLANSLLVRLHYFKGAGLSYLKPFIHETDLTKRTEIQVFEIDWDRFLADQKKN